MWEGILYVNPQQWVDMSRFGMNFFSSFFAPNNWHGVTGLSENV